MKERERKKKDKRKRGNTAHKKRQNTQTKRGTIEKYKRGICPSPPKKKRKKRGEMRKEAEKKRRKVHIKEPSATKKGKVFLHVLHNVMLWTNCETAHRNRKLEVGRDRREGDGSEAVRGGRGRRKGARYKMKTATRT